MLAPASRRACKKRKSLCPAALAKNAWVAARQPSATGQQAGSALQSWSGCMAKLLEVAKKAASLGFSPLQTAPARAGKAQAMPQRRASPGRHVDRFIFESEFTPSKTAAIAHSSRT